MTRRNFTGNRKGRGLSALPLSCSRFFRDIASALCPPPSTLRGGQILLPSLIILPSLLLFVYLIFETGKLSRGKIRQQFAIDSAAFIQMGDYTNLLNRTAYVNGVFPYRIFKEEYGCGGACTPGQPDCNYLQKSDGKGSECRYKMLYEAGDFPKYTGSDDDPPNRNPVVLDDIDEWPLAFGGPRAGDLNKNPPDLDPMITLISKDQGIKINVSWNDAVRIFTFYSQVYVLLGQVETSQMKVFIELVKDFSFFRQSYWLNVNTAECSDNRLTCGDEGLSMGFKANWFHSGPVNTTCTGNMFMCFAQKVRFWGKAPKTPTPWDPLPYMLGELPPPGYIDMRTCKGCPPEGLFQLAGIKDDVLDELGKGYNVYQSYGTEQNYFNIDFNDMAGYWTSCQGTEMGRPCVHAKVASQCPKLLSGNNCVWPNPTPKYQTRLYP